MSAQLLLRLSVMLTSGCALLLLSYAIGTAPQRPPRHLGIRGARRQRLLLQAAWYRALEPALRFVGARVYGLMDSRNREKLDLQLSIAGEPGGLEPEEVVAISLCAAVASAALGTWYGGGGSNSLLFALLLSGAGLSIPYLVLSHSADQRVRSIALSTPQVVDLLSLSLGAGLDFPSAIRQVLDRAPHSNEAIYEELRLLMQELSLGRTRRVALSEFAERAPCQTVREFVSAIVQSEEQGTPLSDVLRVLASTARMHRSTRAEEAGAKAATKMMVPLILLFACVLCLIAGPIVIELMETMG